MVYAVFVLMLIAACALLLFGGAAAEGAADGLRLFALRVLPCLFPFMVCGKYLISAGVFTSGEKRGGSFVGAMLRWLVCALCGTPSAALVCSGLCGRGCGKRRASMLCAALNQMNPAFVTGLLAAKLLGVPRYGLPLAISHYLPACAGAVIIGLVGEKTVCPSPAVISIQKKSASALFAGSLAEACSGVMQIGGTIVFFRVIVAIFLQSGSLKGASPAVTAAAAGLFEMTNGLALLCGALPHGTFAVCACAGILSFGGICLFVQSKLFFEELSALWYFLTKLIIGAASFGLCFAICPLFAGDVSAAAVSSETLQSAGERAGTLTVFAASAAAACAASFLYARLMIKKPAVQ